MVPDVIVAIGPAGREGAVCAHIASNEEPGEVGTCIYLLVVLVVHVYPYNIIILQSVKV
jgi:hypothetical protein